MKTPTKVSKVRVDPESDAMPINRITNPNPKPKLIQLQKTLAPKPNFSSSGPGVIKFRAEMGFLSFG